MLHKPKLGDDTIAAIRKGDQGFDADAPLEKLDMSLREVYEYLDSAFTYRTTEEIPDVQDKLTDIKYALLDLADRDDLSEQAKEFLREEYLAVDSFQQALFKGSGMRGRRAMEEEAARAEAKSQEATVEPAPAAAEELELEPEEAEPNYGLGEATMHALEDNTSVGDYIRGQLSKKFEYARGIEIRLDAGEQLSAAEASRAQKRLNALTQMISEQRWRIGSDIADIVAGDTQAVEHLHARLEQ